MRKLGLLLLFTFLLGVFSVNGWFDDSYADRLPIDCSNMDGNQTFVVGGSSGVLGNQIIWTICSGSDMALYYNDNSDYIIATETNQTPMEVEFGSGTSFLPEEVWTDYNAVWHFNETIGLVIDSTSNNNDGVFFGNPIRTDTDCIIGGCIDLDENDGREGINVSHSPSLNMTSSHSVEAWVRNENITGNGASPFILKGNGASMNYFYGIANVNLSIFANNGAVAPFGNTLLNIDQWHHVVIVMDNTNSRIFYYLDGVIDQNVSFSPPPPNDLSLKLGYDGGFDGNAGYFDGKLDEIRLSEGLSEGTFINQVYNNYQNTAGYGSVSATEGLPAITGLATYPTIVTSMVNILFLLLGFLLVGSLGFIIFKGLGKAPMGEKIMIIFGYIIGSILIMAVFAMIPSIFV